MQRRHSYAAAGAVLAAGAPLGLLLLWFFDRGAVSTMVYVAVSTLVVFSAFGYILGRQADALADLSRTDPLTELRNRRGFEERLREEVARAGRYGAPLSLLIADIDGLKAINDRHGHDAGNEALRAVASALRQGARQTDLPARIGGDEFAVIAPGIDGPAARTLGERLRAFVAAAPGPGPLTVSVGVATLGAEAPSPSALVRAADEALYRAKRSGRNRVA